MNYSAIISVKPTCERNSVCGSLRASWSYSSSSVSIATRQKDRRPPPPSTHIPLHSRLCNYDCCRPASPLTVLQALPGINSWWVKGITMTVSQRGVSGPEPGPGWGGINVLPLSVHVEVSTFPIPVCLTRWSAELLVLVIERRRARATCIARLQMGS